MELNTNALNASEKISWTNYVDSQFGLLTNALESADRETLFAFAVEGIASRLDNKFSTADRKREAVKSAADLTLASILPTSRKGAKAGLIQQAFDLISEDATLAAELLPAVTSGKVKELEAALRVIAERKASPANVETPASDEDAPEVKTRKAHK